MRIVPYIPLFTTTATKLAPYWTAVAISCPVMRKSPSPQRANTGRFGSASLAATAAGYP